MALENKGKGAVSWFTRLVMGIKRVISFFATPIGQVVMYIVAALLMGLLVYIIVAVIAKDIGKLVGVEAAAAQSDKDNYTFLTDLTNSGYDAMLNAEELVDFYAFEYAVLMDAARFMEETGTQEVEPRTTSSVDCDVLDDENYWRYMLVQQHQMPGTDMSALEKYIQQTDPDFTSPEEKTQQEREKKQKEKEEAEKDKTEEFIDLDKFSTDATKDELFYYPVYNEYTKEYSLIPYLELEAQWDKLTYYIEMTNPDGSAVYKPGDKIDATSYANYARWSGVYITEGGVSLEDAYKFFSQCHAAKIVVKLNASNWSLFTRQDAVWGTGPEVIDLYEDYE